MKSQVKRVLIGILLLITASALIFYGAGMGANVFGMPLYKLLLSIALLGWLLCKVLFKSSLRERLSLFIPLALLFMLLEPEIASWCSLGKADIIDNWFVIMAAIVAEGALCFIIPKSKHKGPSNRLSSATHYIDAKETKRNWIKNRMGDTSVYYQNTEIVEADIPLELTLDNKMGNISVYVPSDWIIVNKINNNMGNIEIRENIGNGVTLTVLGNNKMGNIEITSP